MSSRRNARLISALEHATAEFVNRESNRKSLITVMRVELAERDRLARIFVSVLPADQTGAAIDFLSRHKEGLSEYLKKKIQIHALPRIEFLPDPNMGGHGGN